jgi:hypothetical protein
MYAHRISLILEVLSFFLVAPEFLGSQRLRSIETSLNEWAAKELERLKKRESALRDYLGLTEKFGLRGEILIFVLGTAGAVGMIYWVDRLPLPHPPGTPRWDAFLVDLVIFVAVLFIGFVLSYLIYFWPGAIKLIAVRIAPKIIQSLAGNERLRFLIFWLGASLFVISKVLQWFVEPGAVQGPPGAGRF